MKRIPLFLILLAASVAAFAQVTSNPSPIPVNYTGEIILTYDPKAGNGGMAKATECYSHIGVITALSDSDTDWKYIKNNAWGTTNEPKWTKTDDGMWQLVIDNMYTYFGCPESETIKAIVMVFHNGKGNSSYEGKTADEGNILVYVGKKNTTVDKWGSFEMDPVVEKKRPAGVDMGIYYDENDPTTVTLCTFAAGKQTIGSTDDLEPAQHVFLLGDMNSWTLNNDYQLYRDGNYFWITLTGLKARREYRYQYAVVRADGVKKQISDLYSEKVLCKDDESEPRKVNPTLIAYPSKGADGGYVSVFQTGKKEYEWSAATLNFKRPDKNNLVIYELWIYDYTPSRCITGLMERLDYLERLGVNAIELMPVTEFDGNYNWGYSPNHYFALDKAYGTPEQMKQLVDECHKRGIAVILDMVFNHATGNNPMNKLYPYGSDLSENPWFNVTPPHKAEDGGMTYYEDWNHDFEPTRRMFCRALQYWLTEYKVDGFRMDLSHGFCGKNCNNRYNNLKEYYNAVKQVSEDAYFIQEYWGSGYPYQSDLINDGMLCWTGFGLSEAYGQLAMGYSSNSSIADANRDGYVAYNESHDEERNFYKAKEYGAAAVKNDEETRVGRVPAIMAFNTLLNGSHMIYQFGELGFDYSINSGGGRTNTKARIENLGWLEWGSLRMQQYEKVAQAIQLRTRLLPEVFAGNPTTQSLASGFIRSVRWDKDVYVVANFSPDKRDAVTLPSGTWYDYYEQKKASPTYTLEPGELKIFTGKQIPLPVVDGSQTDIFEQVADFSGSNYKLMRNGQLLIISEGMAYDALGRRIE